MAAIFVVEGLAGGTFFLSGDRVVVGRASECQVVLPSAAGSSARSG